ncbi:hypothetical protein M8C13_43080 [Crossiella sp. SN42]|uniref:hypothetical protein n=1 Tax=Crossiella sp. SN42 TaxID=2944808 RepID=UPI00207CB056|nr:hypothetical protein [Crossiella sp. SN42]MCO1582550.1 hypothetical protein [Crossiella sp. SN42]
MSAAALLHIQASIWGKTDNRIAVLRLGGVTPRDQDGESLLVRAALQGGMKNVAELGRLFLPTPRGWLVRLDRGDLVTVEWPKGPKLVAAAPIGLPAAWRWAANRIGKVVLLVDAGVNAPLQASADRGNLVGAAVGFQDHAGPPGG